MQLVPSGGGQRRAGDGEAVRRVGGVLLAAGWLTFLFVAYNVWMPWPVSR